MLNSTIDYLSTLGHSLGNWAEDHLFNIVLILVVTYVLRYFVIRVLDQAVSHTVRRDLFPTEQERKKRVETLHSLVSAVVRVSTTILAVVMVISELGINTGPLLASAGFLGVAVGLGAQSLLKDFLAGIFIITENQYRVGDVVNIASHNGIVEAITVRTTILRDLEGNVHHIPNGTISATANMTSRYSRISEQITVEANTDLHKLEHIVEHIGEELSAMTDFQHKITDPPHIFQVSGIDNGGLVIRILATVIEGEQWNVKSQFYKLLVKAAKKNNIKIISTKQVTDY